MSLDVIVNVILEFFDFASEPGNVFLDVFDNVSHAGNRVGFQPVRFLLTDVFQRWHTQRPALQLALLKGCGAHNSGAIARQ